MKFRVGDTVQFLNEKGQGTISRIISKYTVSVIIEHGFELPYPISELLLVGVDIEQREREVAEEERKRKENEIKPEDLEKLFSKRSESVKISKPHKKNNIIYDVEIDLHIEELISDHRGMSNAEIVRVQLKHFQDALDKAIIDHCRTLTVIHGVGNGRLKQEVRAILDDMKLRYHDASYAKYGFGATEIIIG
jgi:dsDNA-specific endonuclease/ATPase MutS2